MILHYKDCKIKIWGEIMENMLFKYLTEGEKETCSICIDWGFTISCKDCPVRANAIKRMLRPDECRAKLAKRPFRREQWKKMLQKATNFVFRNVERSKRSDHSETERSKK